MPQQPMMYCEIFDSLTISRWVEAKATSANDAKTIVELLKSNIFCWFGVIKAMISDQSSHFCN
ncbi:hypothetical protein CR513_53975, partial [Mucuna pruriens]